MKLKEAIKKSAKSFYNTLPIILGTILLVSLLSSSIPKSIYTSLFSNNIIINSLIGSIIGSISVGTPITSYIFGGEMLKQGIDLIVITAFLVSWVTVGVIQLPAESSILGKRFALTRNLLSFIFAIITAIITVVIMNLI